MDGQLYRQGQTVDITIPATGKLAVFTDGKAIVSQISGPALSKLSQGVVVATVSLGVPYLSAAYSAGATLRINNLSEAPVFYNYGIGLASTLKGIDSNYQPTPGTLNATGALTTALIQGKVVTSTTAAAVTATLDTGTVTDATGVYAVGDSWDWTAIATGANAFTVTAASGHTLEGSGTVATATSGYFRTRKTAANTFVTTRLS